MRLFGLRKFVGFETVIWPSFRFDISLQNFKKPLNIFSPQIERKRSKEYLVILLPVKESLERFSCLEFIFEKSKHREADLKHKLNASVNSSCAQPQHFPPPPPGYCGAFASLVSPGGGAFANFALPGDRVFANPELLTRTQFPINITTQRILLERQADWLICQGREKIEEVCKDMFSILCMHFFIAYQARIT